MECTNCKAIVNEGEKFCANCGAAITSEIVCKSCNTVNSAGSKFCENCGNLLVSEEKPVTKKEQVSDNTQEKHKQGNTDTIEGIIKNNLVFKDSDFYFGDDIPSKKREGALQSYVSLKDDESIICLYDSTVFGGAKEGICLTNYGIYWKEIAEKGNSVIYSNIKDIQIKNKQLFVNDLKVETCNCKEKLKKTLEEIIVLFGR